MKIAFLISAGRFPAGILQELRAQLPQHQLIHWTRGESSPATDIDVLLVLGEVAAAEMASQTKLTLIQTVTAGCEGIDIDAANKLGIWVSFSPCERRISTPSASGCRRPRTSGNPSVMAGQARDLVDAAQCRGDQRRQVRGRPPELAL